MSFQQSGGLWYPFASGISSWKQTIRLAGGSVLGCSSWMFGRANCASAAYEFDFSNSPSKSW